MNNKIKIFSLLSWLFLQSFSCLAQGWQLPAAILSDGIEHASNPEVAMNSAGNAIVIWQRWYSGGHRIQAVRYDKEVGTWSEAEYLSDAGQMAFSPEVAMDSAGNAVVVWYRADDGTGKKVVQTKSYDGAAWSSVTDLSDSGQDASSPQVAMGSAGNAVAVWYRTNDGTGKKVVQTKSYDGSSWSSVTDLSDSGQDADSPEVAMDSAGNAVVVWRRTDDGTGKRVIQTKRYDGATWSVLATNLSDSGQDASSPEVAMDSTGNAVAVWRRYDGSNYIIQTKRYAEAAWSSVTNLSADGQHAYEPQVAMDPEGNTVAVWYRYNGIIDVIQTKSYDGVEWSASVTDLSENSYMSQVAMDSAGNAIVVWMGYDGGEIVQATRYDGAAWSEITNLSGISTWDSRVAMDSAGNAIAVWERSGGKSVIQAVLFKPPFDAPSNLVASKKTHRFPTQIDLIHSLLWDAVENATKYRVYLDTGTSMFLASEPAAITNPFTDLHGRYPGMSYTYEVVAVDPDGDDGLPASVII